MADAKTQFLNRLVTTCNALRDVIRETRDLKDIYLDLGYNNGGSDPIVDGDLASDFNVVADDIDAAGTLLNQLINFADNAAVTQADYGATLSKMALAKK